MASVSVGLTFTTSGLDAEIWKRTLSPCLPGCVAKMDARDSLFPALTPIITSFERVAAIFSKNLTLFSMSKKGVFMSQWICRFSPYMESANGQYSPTPNRWTARAGAAVSSQVERKPLSRCVYLVLLLGSPRLSRGTIGAEETLSPQHALDRAVVPLSPGAHDEAMGVLLDMVRWINQPTKVPSRQVTATMGTAKRASGEKKKR